MEHYLFLIPLFPLLAFAINILFGRAFIREQAAWIAAPAVFISWLLSLAVLREVSTTGEPLFQHLFTWIPAGPFVVEANLYVDQLTAVMLMVVTTVSFLVHVYSVGYMRGDGGFYRFFAYLPLFVFSMLMLVLADNFLLLFVFWEGVGLCSYLLIGFWFRRRSAIMAARKAFVVNRIGDVGFGLAIMWIFTAFGTLNFQDVFAAAPSATVGTLTGISLLLVLGACGKSAQFPLHVWLPDAMEGPTPVSALIHAATMVTAGIYLVARAHPIVELAPTAMVVIAVIGGFTAFMAATIGMVQNDIKRVIAYSTLSQLGYMALALGVGAWTAAIFHLMTHAFFKALLFLGSGSVIHGMHEEQDIRVMGGLRKYMPVTFWTFLIASFANAGVIPFSGFWSKDEIILSTWVAEIQPLGKILTVVAIVTAFFTALYMFRVVFLVFTGKERFDPNAVRPHESPPSMTVPLVLLAIPSLLIGFVGFPPESGIFHRFLAPVFNVVHHEVVQSTQLTIAALSTVAAVSGVAIAYLAYGSRVIDTAALARRHSAIYSFLYDKWRWDEFYGRVFVQPFTNLARWLWKVVDEGIIDGTVNGVAIGIGAISQRLRHVQTGLVTNYALAIAFGMVLMLGIYLGLFSNFFR
ncbi:MAG: NADH-quinone oxidoreductase subunit L [Thermomicrobiales bacterium]|nr:NADH-quinone oxidoreductase subunit L [Thermomicrobiales bacterium]